MEMNRKKVRMEKEAREVAKVAKVGGSEPAETNATYS